MSGIGVMETFQNLTDKTDKKQSNFINTYITTKGVVYGTETL